MPNAENGSLRYGMEMCSSNVLTVRMAGGFASVYRRALAVIVDSTAQAMKELISQFDLMIVHIYSL